MAGTTHQPLDRTYPLPRTTSSLPAEFPWEMLTLPRTEEPRVGFLIISKAGAIGRYRSGALRRTVAFRDAGPNAKVFFKSLIRSGVYNRDRDLRRDSRVCDKIKSNTNARKAGKTDDTGYGSAPRWGEKQQRWYFARLQEVNGYDEVTSGITMTGMGTTGQEPPWVEGACVATG